MDGDAGKMPELSCNLLAGHQSAGGRHQMQCQSTRRGALIKFSITDNGKVGIGTTFYRLNDGPTTSGMGVTLNSPGQHTLEFWSVDQAGNVESPASTVSFSILSDTTAPTTTTNIIEGKTYYQGVSIEFNATDNSPTGVKTTYRQFNNGPIKTGNVQHPTTPGTYNYELKYWSEDYAYNIENPPSSVNFSVINGTGTLRLIWGGSPTVPPGPGDKVTWNIREGGPSGPLVRQGSASYPWSGVNDIIVPIYGGKYYVWVFWKPILPGMRLTQLNFSILMLRHMVRFLILIILSTSHNLII